MAAAVAAGIGSFALGETDLLRVAIVIVVVCALTWFGARVLPTRLNVTCRTDPIEAPVGDDVRVLIDARATRAMMPASVVCHVVTEAGLSSTEHLAVPSSRLRSGIRLEFSTSVRSRGLHTLGPFEATMRDSLGLVSTRHLATERTSLLGLPRWYDVHPAWLRTINDLPWGGDVLTEEGMEAEPDVSIREHRPEDGLRRIHWRTSARTGRLMTRLDEPESERTVVLAFETRAGEHRADTFESTMQIVASLGIALLRAGWDIRIVTSVGERRAPRGAWEVSSLLRFLALAEPVPTGTAPPLPADRTPVILVTTRVTADTGSVARVIYVRTSPGAHRGLPPHANALLRGRSVADLLGAAPRQEASA